MILREKPVHASSASHLDLIGSRAKTNAYHPSPPLRPPLPLFTVNQLTRRAGPVQAHYLFSLRYVSRHHPTTGSPWRQLPSRHYVFSLLCVQTSFHCLFTVEKNYQAPTIRGFSACVQISYHYLSVHCGEKLPSPLSVWFLRMCPDQTRLSVHRRENYRVQRKKVSQP